MSIYLQRYAYPQQLIEGPPSKDTDIIVVIPSFNEENLIQSVRSLRACRQPDCTTEVIIIINESANCEISSRNQNQKSFAELEQWIQENNTEHLKFYVKYLVFTPKNAGVGMARKSGMDEAVRRFELLDNPSGIICCFDADSTCDPNYLEAVHDAFHTRTPTPHGASIYFEHPTGSESAVMNKGIEQYELHLRYYVNALRFAGFPFAFQTIGSSMAVRSDVYQKQGGMNKRKAGEDFYFLHKIIPLGQFIEINNTKVIPSARISDRVPFGTGRAMADWFNNPKDNFTTYNFAIFKDLKLFFAAITQFYKSPTEEIDKVYRGLPMSIQGFLPLANLIFELTQINKQSSSRDIFIHRFFLWFNGFKVLKFVHFARDRFYNNEPVMASARSLAESYFDAFSADNEDVSLLSGFREQDRKFRSERISLKHLYSD